MPYLDDDIPLLNVEEEPGESQHKPALRDPGLSAREGTFDEVTSGRS